jgi:hypothetical protein
MSEREFDVRTAVSAGSWPEKTIWRNRLRNVQLEIDLQGFAGFTMADLLGEQDLSDAVLSIQS